ncbi:hypothetical protein BV898_11630 [Hypsibius exemplaris]|uniref:Uncharacterized protein n=1 Tax=Hypsibius exemplaris TaxID=2072580 RepID=A0A1W0WG39_HYPEX|nr:hypothetical protein BV898_11630 [Hypsibius exemplaris]
MLFPSEAVWVLTVSYLIGARVADAAPGFRRFEASTNPHAMFGPIRAHPARTERAESSSASAANLRAFVHFASSFWKPAATTTASGAPPPAVRAVRRQHETLRPKHASTSLPNRSLIHVSYFESVPLLFTRDIDAPDFGVEEQEVSAGSSSSRKSLSVSADLELLRRKLRLAIIQMTSGGRGGRNGRRLQKPRVGKRAGGLGEDARRNG